jgi:hypothetical protein
MDTLIAMDNAMAHFVTPGKVKQLVAQNDKRIHNMRALLQHDFSNLNNSKDIDDIVKIYHAVKKAGLV